MVENRKERRGLGRGLSALMADVRTNSDGFSNVSSGGTQVAGGQELPIENIFPNPHQPRRSFDKADLESLASSIRKKGIIQPLIVRKNSKQTGTYEIIAGERRWRAAQAAQLHTVPVIVRAYDDEEVLEIAIIENVQRTDLNPVEEAMGYRQLMDRFGHTQEKMAEALGKSRPYIANLLRLLSLPEDVLKVLQTGELSIGHARALITAAAPSQLARMVIKRGLSVRETERLAKGAKAEPQKTATVRKEKDADTRALEADLSANLRMKVAVDHITGREGGKVVISYKSLNELDDLCRLLTSYSSEKDDATQ